jgi:copper(I)-binding protein
VTRWNRRLLLGAIAVLVPVLAGCEAGANAPTLMFHPASFGTSDTVNGVTIDDAFVLGPALNSALPAGGQAGVFLSLETVNSDQLMSVTAPGAARSVQLVSGPVTLTPYSVVNLSGPQPQIVLNGLSKPLSGGQMVNLVLDFASAGMISIQVPVEPAAYDYATYSPPPVVTPLTPTASASPPAPPSGSPSASTSPSASPSGG